MRRFFYALIFLGVGFAIGISYRQIKSKVDAKRFASSCRTAYATHPVLKKRPFVIITTNHDNEQICEKTLHSILTQNYENFRLIYIDKGANERCCEKVQSVLRHYDREKDTAFLQASDEQGRMECFYHAIHNCKSEEIVLLIDAGEFLAQSDVLNRLNQYYATPEVWVTQGNFLSYPSYIKQEKALHTRTFYAGLFKRIPLQHFLEEGLFSLKDPFQIFEPPLKEFARNHIYFTPDTFYISSIERLPMDRVVQNSGFYSPLSQSPTHEFIESEEHTDLVVFSCNHPMRLYAFLESAQAHLHHLRRLYVVYRAENEYYEQGYQTVKKDFPQVTYVNQSCEDSYEDFAPLVLKTVFDRETSTARYVAFAVDDDIIKGQIDMKQATQLLKKTGAYGVYFCLGRQLDIQPSKVIPLGENTFAWQFSSGKGVWACPNSVHMALFKKEAIYPYFLCMKFNNPNILQALWNEHADLSKVGLYYDQSTVVTLPLSTSMKNDWFNEKGKNGSEKELLTFFNQGLKMDIRPLSKIENSEIEIHYEPQLIKREM